MDDEKKKQVMITIVVVCLVLAVGVTIVTNFGPGGGGASGVMMQMLCANDECGIAYEMSREDFEEVMREKGSSTGPMMGPAAFTCQDCGEESAFIACKCKECGNVFFYDYASPDDIVDRCPECGYSDIEEDIDE